MEENKKMESYFNEIQEEKFPDVNVVVAVTKTMGMSHRTHTHMPWPKNSLSLEKRWFEDITTQVTPEKGLDSKNAATMNAVIMGYNTWNKEPIKFYPNRINVVVSRTLEKTRRRLSQDKRKEPVHDAESIEDAVRFLQKTYPSITGNDSGGGIRLGRIFVIGGADLCRTAIEMPWVSRILLTKAFADFPCDDTFFPVGLDPVGNRNWKRKSDGGLSAWAGSIAPIGVKDENAIAWEVYMFQRRINDDEQLHIGQSSPYCLPVDMEVE